MANNYFAQSIKSTSWCGSDEYYQQQIILHPEILEKEKELNEYFEAIENDSINITSKKSTLVGVKKIPVVFHLIGDNVIAETSYLNLINQIEVLNNDYRKKPATTGFGTGVDVEVEFCLASKDPEGFNTSGYVEVSGNYGAYPSLSNSMKILSVWPSQNYLNVWIVKEIIGAVGYATFPSAFANSPQFDGVVLDKLWVGFNAANSLTTGRTLTHEVGHWLGIKHPFTFDSICVDGDGCADTPDANGTFFSSLATNCLPPLLGNPKYCPLVTRQIENYMDYSYDACFSKFTECQKGKMRGYLEAVRWQIIAPTNKAACDASYSGGLGSGTILGGKVCDGNTFCYKGCSPRKYVLNIGGGLKGSTGSHLPRELIATYIIAGGSGYHMAPSPTGKVTLIADYCDSDPASRAWGSISLTDGFYFYSSGTDEINFKICNLLGFEGARPWIKCGRWTDDPNPDNNDRNKRIIKQIQDSVFGVYIKPPQSLKLNNSSVIINKLTISVFPNPSEDAIFNLNDDTYSNTILKYKVINSLGIEIKQGEFKDSLQIDLSNCSKGIYQILICNPFTSISKTIIYN